VRQSNVAHQVHSSSSRELLYGSDLSTPSFVASSPSTVPHQQWPVLLPGDRPLARLATRRVVAAAVTHWVETSITEQSPELHDQQILQMSCVDDCHIARILSKILSWCRWYSVYCTTFYVTVYCTSHWLKHVAVVNVALLLQNAFLAFLVFFGDIFLVISRDVVINRCHLILTRLRSMLCTVYCAMCINISHSTLYVVFRLTPQSWPNRVGLNVRLSIPMYVRSSTKSFSDFNKI